MHNSNTLTEHHSVHSLLAFPIRFPQNQRARSFTSSRSMCKVQSMSRRERWREHMVQLKFRFVILSCLTAVCALAFAAVSARAQQTGGDLVGGAGIFRPKN